MAISGVSSVSAGGIASLFRAPLVGAVGRADSVPRLEAIPSLAGREDAEPSTSEARADPPRLQADPRRAESLVSERGERSAEVASQLSQLKARDAEVRAHESAHMAAGGRFVTGGASYTYQKGPDGGQYAVGGEVGIDTSPVPGKPEETVRKMRVIRAAALAPSEPSAADLAVAAAAAQAEAAALAEIAQARTDRIEGTDEAAGLAGAAGRYSAESKAGSPDGSPTREPLDMVA